MQVLTGIHKHRPLPLTAPDLNERNMLPSGQLVDFETDDVVPISMPLAPEEASVHHSCAINGSLPNMSERRRMGLTFCFQAPSLGQSGKLQTSAMLVRGEDHYGFYYHEQPPIGSSKNERTRRHTVAVALYRAKEAELGKRTVTRLD